MPQPNVLTDHKKKKKEIIMVLMFWRQRLKEIEVSITSDEKN